MMSRKIAPKKQSKDALVISFQSWTTPIIALIMLAAGLVGGYYFRGVQQPDGETAAMITVVATAQPSQPDQANPASLAPTSELILATPFTALAPTVSPTAGSVDMDTAIALTRHFRGDPDAPVTIIEFSDFQWPYCGRFATGAGRQIEEEYVQEGIVRYGFMQMAFLSDASQWAAEATECAAEQNEPAFWLFHTKLFDNLTSDNKIPVTKDSLKAFATELGLDTAAFSTCLDTGKYTQLVETETQSARDLGIKSTPTLFINGQMVTGAKSFETFKTVIDAAAGLSPQAAAPSPNTPANTPSASDKNAVMQAAIAAAHHFKGQPDAPVVMIELSNFLWPYCGRYATGAGRQIDEQFIQTGVVRYGIIQLAFTEGEATLGAEAAECAGEQSEPAYWLYHNRLYDELVSPNRAAYNAENLKRFANELGLDGTAFSQCLDAGRYAADIQEQKQAAYALDVYNTPTFFINGSQIQGDQPFETFKSMIEAAASLLP